MATPTRECLLGLRCTLLIELPLDPVRPFTHSTHFDDGDRYVPLVTPRPETSDQAQAIHAPGVGRLPALRPAPSPRPQLSPPPSGPERGRARNIAPQVCRTGTRQSQLFPGASCGADDCAVYVSREVRRENGI